MVRVAVDALVEAAKLHAFEHVTADAARKRLATMEGTVAKTFWD